MKTAFLYMFKDNMFLKKATTLSLLIFTITAMLGAPELLNTISSMPEVNKVAIPIIHWLPILALPLLFIQYGYMATSIKAIMQQDSSVILPFLNLRISAVKGFKIFLAIILALLFLTLLGAVEYLIAGVLKNPVLVVIIQFIVATFVLFYITALLWIFALEEKVLSLFAFRKATNLIKNNFKKYLLSIALIFLINVVSAFLSSMIIYGLNYLFNNIYMVWLLSSLIGAIIACYVIYVSVFLVARSIKNESLA